MSKKQEIKVYLPAKMVGELESRRKAGVRSKFIADAIRGKLDKRSQSSPWDFELHLLLCTARDMLHKMAGSKLSINQSVILVKMIQVVIDEVYEYES
jgi:metal-responsive CopG/Arc/MetJ family transcriptional regulator